jgi:hypothetical protein
MAIVNFTNLDFDQIKESIKDYLRSNSNFSDYDFEGSNLATIIDVLAYNTYITSYNANMVSNEVFIDSATLRENVVSLARNIGYVPRSRNSAKASINFFVDTTVDSTRPIAVTLKRGLVCTSRAFGITSYTFSILDDITVPVNNGIALFNDLIVYEGIYTTQSITVDPNTPNQRFILDNSYIDTTTIRVSVRDSATSTVSRKFTLANSLFEVESDSRVFFIQEIEDQRYELIFGDNIFGKKLDAGNIVEVSYIISNGASGNGISQFNYSGRLFDTNDRIITSGISLISINYPSQNGREIESVNSIKKYAPRIYASQYRAVTAKDYEAIVPQIYPESESVSAFGGEELSPPNYGKVFITIKPKNGPFVPSQVKDNLKDLLRKYSVAGIVPEILDLAYLYIEFDTKAYYNKDFSLSPDKLRTSIIQNIKQYSEETFNSYGSRFKYSKFLKVIDDTNQAITSNITKITMRRDLRASLGSFSNYLICFGNSIYSNVKGFNIKSSGFLISGVSDTVYLSDIPNSDGKTGKIVIFKLLDAENYKIIRSNAGKIDYEKGEINLFATNITNTSRISGEDNIIEISAIPLSNDIIGKQNLYIQLDINSSIVDMIPDQSTVESNSSGSQYITTSSYTNGNFVRP